MYKPTHLSLDRHLSMLALTGTPTIKVKSINWKGPNVGQQGSSQTDSDTSLALATCCNA